MSRKWKWKTQILAECKVTIVMDDSDLEGFIETRHQPSVPQRIMGQMPREWTMSVWGHVCPLCISPQLRHIFIVKCAFMSTLAYVTAAHTGALLYLSLVCLQTDLLSVTHVCLFNNSCLLQSHFKTTLLSYFFSLLTYTSMFNALDFSYLGIIACPLLLDVSLIINKWMIEWKLYSM